MTPTKEMLIAKIDFVIQTLIDSGKYSNHRAANHFVNLRRRFREDKTLTKKMKENLSWIEQNVIEERTTNAQPQS